MRPVGIIYAIKYAAFGARGGLFALLLAAASPLFGQGGPGRFVVYENAFPAGAITAPATSAVLPNVGQGLHLLIVRAADAMADVTTDTQIRLEAAFECPDPGAQCSTATWFPITTDITLINHVAAESITYAMVRGNGSYPHLRVNAVDVNASFPLTINYIGSTFPIGNVFFDGSRWRIGPFGGSADKVTFALCLGSPCATGTNLTNPYIVTAPGQLTACYIDAGTVPTGASLIVDIHRNGTTIFPASPKLVFPDGGAGPIKTNVFAQTALAEFDVLTVDIDQVGSSDAGQDVSAVCTIQN
jgi:hypothetical protein